MSFFSVILHCIPSVVLCLFVSIHMESVLFWHLKILRGSLAEDEAFYGDSSVRDNLLV